MISYRRKFLFVLVLLYIYGCVSKDIPTIISSYDNQTDNKTEYHKRLKTFVEEVNRKSLTICSYKSKVIFDYQDEKIKVKMHGIVQKDCENNGEVLVIGPFGIVLYNAKYNKGELEITKDNSSVIIDDKNKMKIYDMLRFINLLNYPGIRPDETFDFKEDGNNILFYKDNTTLLAEDYRIKKIFYNGLIVEYEVDQLKLKGVTIIQKEKERYLRINFN
jgi:hypothetical protein